jgi:hypothetical protein
LEPINLAFLCEVKLDLIEELEVIFKNQGGTQIFGSTQ